MRRPTIGTSFAGVLGTLAIAGWLLLSSSAPATHADHLLDDIHIVAIDMNTTGNNTVSCAGDGCAPGTLGTIETCAAVNVGGSVDVDIVVDFIPSDAVNPSGAGPNIQGFEMNLILNSAIVEVSAVNGNGPGAPPANLSMISAGTPPGPRTSFTEPTSDSDDFFMGETDLGTTGESGKGILMRLTLTGLGAGASTLHLQHTVGASPDPLIFDNSGSQNEYTIDQNDPSLIVVGGTCPQSVASPTGRFCIYGSSTGVGWIWRVTGTPGPFIGNVTVPSGGSASDLATAWTASMNGPFPAFGASGVVASPVPNRPNCFDITPWTNRTLIVSTVGLGSCTVTSAGCSFNPTVFQVSPVGGITELRVNDSERQPADSSSPATSFPYGALGSALAFGAALLGAGLLYGRRWWLR